MPTISGSLHDVTGHSTTAREVLVRAKFLRASAGTVTTTETRQVAVSDAGEVSFDCEPGPAVMLVVYAKGAPLEVPLVIGPDSSELGDVADAAAIADDIDRGRLEDLARELVALAHQVRSDRNDVAEWYPQIEGWHSDVDAWQAQVAEDREIAHDASALAVLAAANAGRIMGTGSPEGVKDAPIGTIYVNTANGELWNKTTMEGSTSGWKLLGAPDASALWWKPRLTSANDLNDIRGSSAPGVYPVASTVVNGPGMAGDVTVTFDSNRGSTKQIFGPAAMGNYRTLVRDYLAGTWSEWKAISWFAGTIASSQDLDTVATYGVHQVNSANTPHWPFAGPGSLEVLPGGTAASAIIQRAVCNSTTTPQMAIRSRWSTSWTDWLVFGAPSEPVEPETPTWVVQTSGFSGDVDTLTAPGAYSLLTSASNKPFTPLGSMLVLPVAYGACTQIAVNWSTGEQWFRRTSSGTFNAWSKLGGGATTAPTTVRSTVGYREVPLSITAPGTTSTQEVAAGSVRWVRSWAHAPRRFRVHVMNRNPANAVNSGTVTLTGGSYGIGHTDGTVTSSATLFANGSVIPASVGELVSKWMEFPGTDKDALAISLGWSGASTQQRLQGGGWTSTHANDWSSSGVSGWTFEKLTPFYVWIEAEVPATAPIILVNGDSISIGTASDNPVNDAWPAIHAKRQGALPVFFSQHGSSMNGWTTSTSKWNNMYPGTVIAPDAILSCLGQNDLTASGMDLPTLQSRFQAVQQAYTERWPGVPVYAASVTPSTKPSDVEAVRRTFNAWLAGLPDGVRGFLDLVPVVGNAEDENLNPTYSADGLHPNSAGQIALAGVLDSRPVTPFVLNQAQLRDLVA